MTMWSVFLRRRRLPALERMRIRTPDGDELTLLRLPAVPEAPRILLLHGLEGGERSHYVGGVFREAHRRGWGADLLIFRTCDGRLNDVPRSYHSGETTDLEFVANRVAQEYPRADLGVVGVSLGGNVLLKWLGERAGSLPPHIRAAVAVSVPFDLAQSSRYMHRGASRAYERHFLRRLQVKALGKIARRPGLASAEAVRAATTLWAFDDVFTAPVHGFADAADYYRRSSAMGFLAAIRVPTLLLSARDDPFLPPDILPQVERLASRNPVLTTEFPLRGGHVGFVEGRWPWRPSYYIDRRTGAFLGSRFRGSPPQISYGAPTDSALRSG